MFVLPKKPSIKKAIIKHDDEDNYTFTITTPLRDKEEFYRVINQVSACLADIGGGLIDSNWETKSIKMKMQDIKSFHVYLSRRFYFIQRE